MRNRNPLAQLRERVSRCRELAKTASDAETAQVLQQIVAEIEALISILEQR